MLIYGLWTFTTVAQDAWEVLFGREPHEPLDDSINWHAHGFSMAGLADADMNMSTMITHILTD